MSDIPADDPNRLNISELVSRIDRQREEALKFAAEQRKLIAEEQKLRSEAEKLLRDRFLAPWTLAFLILGAFGGLLAGIGTIVRLFAP